MAYDPKKSRAKKKDQDVVEEILKDEKPKAKKPVAEKTEAAKKPEPSLKIVKDEEELEKIHAEDAPLFMQPQVWITLAASAIVALLLIKKRRKK